MDINQSHVAKEIGAVSMGDSDAKFDESAFEFISSTWKEYDEELYYDAISGEVMIKELVEAARKEKMETFKTQGVYEKVPIEMCWEETGADPIRTRWIDVNKGNAEKPDYRSRLVAQEIKKDTTEDIFAAAPPVEAEKMLIAIVRSGLGVKRGKRMKLDFIDVRRAYFHTNARRRVFVRLAAQYCFFVF